MTEEALLQLNAGGKTLDVEFTGEEKNALNQHDKNRSIYGSFTAKSVIYRFCGKSSRVLSEQNLIKCNFSHLLHD